jgi:DNA-nicking Smr family endonuclease
MQAMLARGIVPDAITYAAAVEALHAALQHGDCCRLYREAVQKGHFAYLWPMLSKRDRLSCTAKLDLHVCSAALANTVLRCFLEDTLAAPATRRGGTIRVVTGKGLGSGEDGPVLAHSTRAFLVATNGPTITEVPNNAGCFLLLEEDVAAWRSRTRKKFDDAGPSLVR